MKVRLQAMTDEAKELVRTGSYDEAIAICRHILKQHPRYVEAYRVLAEACLEKGDYEEATDLFKRVLSAAPHNYIAYVGLGIAYDEDGLTDEAIWQFERAFELAPANSEIRQMLRRLYGQRDGVEPQRLKLNRAALGHLYAKGGLYAEAVAEFREVLAQDPERIDMQLAMAEAFWRANKRREAAEVCQDILNKMPNCLKANLLLGEIWSDSGLEDEGETLLRRAKNMDPEGLVAQALLGERSPLPVEEVLVEPLGSVEAELAEVSTAEALAEAAFPAIEAPSAEVSFAEFEDVLLEEDEVLEPEQPVGESVAEPEDLDVTMEATLGEAAEMEADLFEFAPAVEEAVGEIGEQEIAQDEMAEISSTLEDEQTIAVDVEEMAAAATDEGIADLFEEIVAPESEPEAAGEDESPVIAALEAEFGALPELDLSEEAEAERMALEASMPDESASTEEILAWLESQRQPAAGLDALAPEAPEAMAELPVAEADEAEEEGEPAAVGFMAELEDAMQQVAAPEAEPGAASETLSEIEMAEAPVADQADDEGSPVIAALEAEFGSLPGLETEEIGDEERLALESSMPPETASPEEIMAWLRDRGTLTEMMPMPEMPEEGIPEALADMVSLDETEPALEAEAPPEAPLAAVDAGVSFREAQGALREGAVAGEAADARAEIEIEAEAEIAAMALSHDDLTIHFPEYAVEPSDAGEVALEEDETSEAVEAEVLDVEESVPEPVEAELIVEEPAPEAVEAMAVEIEEAVSEVVEMEEVVSEAAEAEVVEMEEMASEAVEAEVVEIEEAVSEAVETEVVEIEEVVSEAVEAEVVEIEEALPEPEMAEVASPVAELMAALEQSPDDSATRLALARAHMEQAALDEAAEQYETLARGAPEALDDVIADLEAIIAEQPELLGLQQVLGDAYMEAGRLQDALDKYNWLLTQM